MKPLIIIVHGSRDPKWSKPIHRFIDLAKQTLSVDEIYLCYMEISEPTLIQICEHLIQAGHSAATVLPFFMASGGHVDRDIPKQVQAVKEAYPQFDIEQQTPIGEHPDVIAAMIGVVKSEMNV
jgi:sirohydrochlorin cobaltochelatase